MTDQNRSTLITQLIPVAPFALLIAFHMNLAQEGTTVQTPHTVSFKVTDAAGNVVEQGQNVGYRAVYHVRWYFAGLTVLREEIVVRSAPQVNQHLHASRNRMESIGLVLAIGLFAGTAWRLRWTDRFSSDAARITPIRALGISAALILVLAVAAIALRHLVSEEMTELQNIYPTDDYWWIMSTLIMAPVSEELVFRAGLFRLLNRRLPVVWSLLLQGVLFGAAHYTNPVHVVVTLFGGICFGLIYWKTNRIWVSIAVHAFANLVFIGFVL